MIKKKQRGLSREEVRVRKSTPISHQGSDAKENKINYKRGMACGGGLKKEKNSAKDFKQC